MIGKRHPFLGYYKVAATKQGKIEAIELQFYSDAGCTYDCSFQVMDVAVMNADNAYFAPQFLVKGDCAMTMKVSSTAFRSFGLIQTMLVVERAVEAIAEELCIPDDKLREMNFYKVDQYVPCTQQLHYCNISGVWEMIKETSEYERRKQEIEMFNQKNHFKKRGMKLIPLKYGIKFLKSLNQGRITTQLFHTQDYKKKKKDKNMNP